MCRVRTHTRPRVIAMRMGDHSMFYTTTWVDVEIPGGTVQTFGGIAEYLTRRHGCNIARSAEASGLLQLLDDSSCKRPILEA